MDLTLVTCTAMPEADVDEQPLLDALAAAGVETRIAAWDDPDVDWGAAPLTVVRSTWNYAHDRRGFLDWMRRASGASTVLRNSPGVMSPNTHKGYLAGLDRAGVDVVPTRWFAGDSAATAAPEALRALPWDRIVAKPAVGGGSLGVQAFALRDDAQLDAAAEHVAGLRRTGEVLVQPQLESIARDGELDIVWIDGEFTHVVTKRDRHEGDEESVGGARLPTNAERQIGEATLRTLGPATRRDLLYARVDVAPDELGTLRVVELELVEPSLFLTHHEPAMERFVAALARESGAAERLRSS